MVMIGDATVTATIGTATEAMGTIATEAEIGTGMATGTGMETGIATVVVAAAAATARAAMATVVMAMGAGGIEKIEEMIEMETRMMDLLFLSHPRKERADGTTNTTTYSGATQYEKSSV